MGLLRPLGVELSRGDGRLRHRRPGCTRGAVRSTCASGLAGPPLPKFKRALLPPADFDRAAAESFARLARLETVEEMRARVFAWPRRSPDDPFLVNG